MWLKKATSLLSEPITCSLQILLKAVVYIVTLWPFLDMKGSHRQDFSPAITYTIQQTHQGHRSLHLTYTLEHSEKRQTESPSWALGIPEKRRQGHSLPGPLHPHLEEIPSGAAPLCWKTSDTRKPPSNGTTTWNPNFSVFL